MGLSAEAPVGHQMKTVAYIILLTVNFGFLRAQTESVPFDVPGDGNDPTYNYLERKSYSVIKTDTLEFNDGSNVYRVIEVLRSRPDTTMKTESASYYLKADKRTETLAYPVYPKKLKNLRITVVDTIYDPSDPTKYLVDKIDSIEVDFAKSYPLNPTTFFQTIRKIESMAEYQGLEVATIVPNFYGDEKTETPIELVDSQNFKDVDFVTMIFLFRKGNLMMDYPILFEQEKK